MNDDNTPDFEEQNLAAIISDEISKALHYDQTEISQTRSRALEYLRGEMNDTPARPNGSSVTSRDLNDTISWMLPGIMRVFMGSERMAEYEPTLREGVDPEVAEEQAEQASDYAQHVFIKDNDGYRIVYNATHDSLVTGNGVVKHWWDDKPVTETTMHSGLVLEQVALLMDDENVEIIAQEEGEPVLMPDETGMPMEVPTFNVKVERTVMDGRLRLDSVEPENFLIDEAAVTIDEARFVAHRDPYVTRSDLIERGFDRDIVEDISADTSILDTEEAFARDQDSALLDQSLLRSTQRIDLYECYMRVDVNDDGVAETIQVFYAGDAGAGRVLEWREWEDDYPFSDIPCYPNPHRFEAESVADRTMDVQKIKTILTRQALDNLYASNLPMREVETGSVDNPDILVSPKFGGIIWRKAGKVGPAVIPHETPFVADKVFNVNQYFDSVLEKRTGVSKTMMALDPEALQNQSATANQNARDAAYSQIELIARNMAELGWRRVFRQLLRLIVKHQQRSRIIRLRGEFVEMDPRVWNSSMDCTVNVGLGTGSRDRDMLMLNQVLGNQLALTDRLYGTGFADRALSLLPRVLNTMRKITESTGLRNPELYYPDWGEEDVQRMLQEAAQRAQQPSEAERIEMAKLEADKEREAAQAQGDVVKNQAELEADLASKAQDRETQLMVENAKIASNERIKAEELMMRRVEIESRERVEMAKLRDREQEREARERERRQQPVGQGASGGEGASATQ